MKIVENYLDKYDLNKSDKTLLVGFSGGCDSLCLLDILHELSLKYGFKLIALHLNHNWRGEESRQEEINCKNFCETKNIDFISETLENAQKTESFARQARYEFFIKHAKNYKNSAVFTAHTRTDNAETLIYRIIKGTGLNGLQGIPAYRLEQEIPICRPLLQLSRKQIEDYCNSKGLVANSDSSNFDINYKRNFIRHKIMPLFEEINFHAEKLIASLAKIAISQSKIVDEYINLINKEIFEDNKISTAKFKNLSDDVIKKIIYDNCLKKALEYDSKKIEDIFDFIKSNWNSKAGMKYSLANDLWLFVSSKYIYLIDKVKSEINESELKINKEGDYYFDGKAFSLKTYEGGVINKFPSENATTAYVDLSSIGVDLTLRTRREGDFITPFGMTGKMKLKKYLNLKSIPQHEKDELIVLAKESEILWVIGVGLSNKLKVVNRPTHVLKLLDKN